MDPQTQQLLQQLGLTANNASGAMQQLIAALNKASVANTNTTNAATLTAQSLQQLQGSSGSLAANFRTALSIGTGFVGSLTSVTSSVYGAEKAFTSVIPTLDAITNIFKTAVTAAGTAFSGVSVLGTSFGKASEAIASGAAASADILSSMAKFQLENSQKVADQFLELSKVGATFGGSIAELSRVTSNSTEGLRIPLANFTRIITQNVENLSKLGMTITQAGKRVAAMALDIYDNSDALVALYGNVENLSVGVAEFLVLQNQLGSTVTFQRQGFESQRLAIQDYLIRQKELTALTGKNAETLKREEEGRRRQLDYNLKLGRLGDEARKNVQEGMAIAGKTFGDAGAKYAEEYFATGGKVYSAEAIAYAATNQEAAKAIEQLMTTVNSSREQYRKGYGQYFAANADTLEAAARSNEDMAEILRASANPIIRGMAETGSSIMQSLEFFRNMPTMVAELEAERNKITSGKLDAATQAFVDAERKRNEIQLQIDKEVLKNMENIGSLVQFLQNATLDFVKAQGAVTGIIEQLKAFKENNMLMDPKTFKEAIGKIVDSLTTTMGVDATQDSVLDKIRRALGIPPTGGPLPVSVVPGPSPLPVAVVPGPGTPVAQGVPSSPAATVAALPSMPQVVAALSKQNEGNSPSPENSVVMAMVERLQSQVASLSTANGNTEQVVSVLTDQNGLMASLNDKMGELIDSNRSIFNALA